MKVSAILALTLTMFFITGCAKCIDTQYSTVDVEIVNEYHRGAYSTPMCAGKTMVLISHPAVYEITVEYNSAEYTISGIDTYDKYSDKVGEHTKGTLEIKSYDNGTQKYRITELK